MQSRYAGGHRGTRGESYVIIQMWMVAEYNENIPEHVISFYF